MKSLWTMRDDDGRLMKWDGTGWSLVGTFAPTQWPTTDVRRYRTYGCFVYRGEVYTRWVGRNSSTGAITSYVGKYAASSGDTTQQASVAGGTNNAERWGNTFEYKGSIWWFAMEKYESGSNNEQYLVLYRFYYVGSTPTLTRRYCTEVGLLNESATSRDEYGNNNAVPYVSADHDRMFMGPPGGVLTFNTSGNRSFSWTTGGSFDIDSSGNVSLSQYGFANPGWLSYAPNDANTQSSRPLYSDLDAVYIATGVWKSKAYGLSLMGRLYEITPGTGARALKFDISNDLPVTGSGGATTFTTDSADTTTNDQNLRFSAANATTAYGFPMAYSNFRVKVLNYGGVSSTVQWGQVEKVDDVGSGRMFYTGYDDTTQARFNGQPTGTQFQGFWTFRPHHGNDTNYSPRYAQILSYNSKLWVVGLSGRNWSNGSITQYACAPWSVTSWDGVTSTGTTTTFRNGSSYFSMASASTCFDESAGLLHVFWDDPDASAVKHATFDLTASPPTLSMQGTVYARTHDDLADRKGLVNECVCCYDNFDITATIGTRTATPSAGTITVPYTLWSSNTNADTCTVKIEYNVGNGWFDCTQKTGQGEGKTSLSASSAGTSHTFVHDAYADLGDFVGSIQHRIGVSSQTRN